MDKWWVPLEFKRFTFLYFTLPVEPRYLRLQMRVAGHLFIVHFPLKETNPVEWWVIARGNASVLWSLLKCRGLFHWLMKWYCSENVGLLGLTHIGSRRVVHVSTAFMFFFSIFGMSSISIISPVRKLHKVQIHFYCGTLHLSGKFGALFASIPLPIFAAAYCVLYGIVGEWFCRFWNFILL